MCGKKSTLRPDDDDDDTLLCCCVCVRERGSDFLFLKTTAVMIFFVHVVFVICHTSTPLALFPVFYSVHTLLFSYAQQFPRCPRVTHFAPMHTPVALIWPPCMCRHLTNPRCNGSIFLVHRRCEWLCVCSAALLTLGWAKLSACSGRHTPLVFLSELSNSWSL